MRYLLISIGFLCIGLGSLKGQTFKLPKQPLSFTEAKPYFSLSANNSRFVNRGVQFWGFGLGYASKEGFSLELNYNWLDSRVISNQFKLSGKKDQLLMHYVSALGSYQFFNANKLSSVFEASIGFGRITFLDLFYGSTVQRSAVLLFEPAIRIRYEILDWLAFGLMTGLRLGVAESPLSRKDINSAKIDIGLSISPWTLIQSIKAS